MKTKTFGFRQAKKVVYYLWLTIDLRSETAIYLQIRDQVIQGILLNELKIGESLPSVRQLAADLGINMHTVSKAYNLLKQEGFIQIHRQKGAIVNAPNSYQASEEYYEQLKNAVKPLIIESSCRGISKGYFYKICEQIYRNFGLPEKGG